MTSEFKSSAAWQAWNDLRALTPERAEIAREILAEIRRGVEVQQATRRHPLPGGGYLPKSVLVAVYKEGAAAGEWPAERDFLARIRMKPVRTLSGVTTVTVLTKPYPCPGRCVFCPTDARMPKSYLPDEPGAMRGLQNDFDPYLQVRSRLEALEATGHPTDKIELLILGGTWSAYRHDYQEWFIRRCFEALNQAPGQEDEGGEGKSLADLQRENETAECRNVGLVIETRPDEINPAELAWLRGLGVTKVQMGAQALDDRVLEMNQRGHTAAETLAAVRMLRAAGFKVVLHWMPNLLGATVESDRTDFSRLWSDGYAPDEIKIYPCQLLANAESVRLLAARRVHPLHPGGAGWADCGYQAFHPTLLPRQPRYPRHPLHQRGSGEPAHQPAYGRVRGADAARGKMFVHPLPRGARRAGRPRGA